jgi:antitoxin YefM
MDTISYTSARNHLAETMDGVCDDHSPVIITRGKSRPAVVMISLEDYQGMQETNYLMRSPNNAARLLDAINEVETLIQEKEKKK